MAAAIIELLAENAGSHCTSRGASDYVNNYSLWVICLKRLIVMSYCFK